MTRTAHESVDEAGEGDLVIGWKLDEEQRRELLQQFPPRFSRTVADHVTLRANAGSGAPLPPAAIGEIVGCAEDGEGVEAMVVAIDGGTDRPGGGTYHITWSLEPGREARESNDVIARSGWRPFALPMPVRLVPAQLD